MWLWLAAGTGTGTDGTTAPAGMDAVNMMMAL